MGIVFAVGWRQHRESGALLEVAPTQAPLEFTLKDVNGLDVRLDSFKGKVVLVNFWATWCLQINYPVLDATGRTDVEDAYGPVWGLPTTILIDRDGNVAKRRSGIGSKEQFEQDVKALF